MIYNGIKYLKDENAYYVIECERIDGTSGLNEKYISNGIRRFIDGKYAVYKNVNGMIGFVGKPLNISANVSKLSELHSYPFIKRL